MSETISFETKKNFWKRLRQWIWDKRIYFLVFAIPSLIMYISYAFFGVHPYGDNSVLVLDLNGQYVYYYEAFRDWLRGGNELFYNWSRNLSGEMFGVFAYYLASPFMLIICFLPRTMMCGAIELLQILKIGTAAVTFAVFLKHTLNARKTSLVIFGSCYGLMSYMVVQLMDPMWLDGLIYLPLIALGIHKLVEKGKMLLFVISLALMFIAHFYIGYMVGIFTFMYFIYCCLSQKNIVCAKSFFKTILKFAVGTLVALLCAAFVLITVYNSLKLGKFEFTEPDFSLATQFDFLSVMTKLFPMSYDSVNVEGLPMIYCGTITVLLIPLFFMNKNVYIKKKVGLGTLSALLLVFMYIRPIDMVWHGFQMPNWLPFRYSFMLSFLLLVMACEAFENLDGITAKEIGGAFFGILIYLFWCERENYSNFQIFETQTKNNVDTTVIQGVWISIISIIICFILLYLFKKYKTSKILCVVASLLIGLELTVNTMDTLNKIDTEVCYSTYDSYEPFMSNTRDAVQQMKKEDNEPFYRMEATFHRTVNDPIGTGYYGISHSSSTMNAPALTLLKQLGFSYGGHSTKYQGATYITDSIFDIKYIMDKNDVDGQNQFSDRFPEVKDKSVNTVIPKGYEKVKEIQELGSVYSFYKNPYALGLGLSAPKSITNVAMNDQNPFENQNIIFNNMKNDNSDFVNYFTKIEPYNKETENLSTSMLTDGHKKYYPEDNEIDECHIDYVLKIDKDSDLYMYLPTDYERSCNVWTQLEEDYEDGLDEMCYAGQFFEGDNYAIMNLGKYKKDDKVRVRVTISNDENEAFWLDELFYTFDFDSFKATAQDLKNNSWNITDFDGNYVEGVVNAVDSNQVLMTTIPYENGWSITVNGKSVESTTSLGCLITVPLEKGKNVVKMKFSPNYFKLSVILSIVGLLAVVWIFIYEYKNGKIIKKIYHRLSTKSVK